MLPPPSLSFQSHQVFSQWLGFLSQGVLPPYGTCRACRTVCRCTSMAGTAQISGCGCWADSLLVGFWQPLRRRLAGSSAPRLLYRPAVTLASLFVRLAAASIALASPPAFLALVSLVRGSGRALPLSLGSSQSILSGGLRSSRLSRLSRPVLPPVIRIR